MSPEQRSEHGCLEKMIPFFRLLRFNLQEEDNGIAPKRSNTPYIVGAGIYDDKATITELQKLTSPGK